MANHVKKSSDFSLVGFIAGSSIMLSGLLTALLVLALIFPAAGCGPLPDGGSLFPQSQDMSQGADESDPEQEPDPDPEEEAACDLPTYPSDCAEVYEMQCGWTPRCENGVVFVDWHEHVFCDAEQEGEEYQREEIVSYSCSHVCEFGCAANPGEWNTDGPGIVTALCAGPDDEPAACPTDLAAAAGTACDTNGQICNADGSAMPCPSCAEQDCEMVICEGGVWDHYLVSAQPTDESGC